MIKDGHPSPQVTPDLNKSSKNWEVLVESPTRDVKGPQGGAGGRREGGANGGENGGGWGRESERQERREERVEVVLAIEEGNEKR